MKFSFCARMRVCLGIGAFVEWVSAKWAETKKLHKDKSGLQAEQLAFTCRLGQREWSSGLTNCRD